MAATVLSLALVLSLDIVAAARLSTAHVDIDAVSGSPLLPQLLVAPLGCLVVALGAWLGLMATNKRALVPTAEP